MQSELIQLAMKQLQCNQKQLAAKLGVSPTQISKWKKGEYMSSEMAQKLEAMLELDGIDPTVVLATGSLEDAKKWDQIIRYLADLANGEAETGYETILLVEDLEHLSAHVFSTFKSMGIVIPKKFPQDLEVALQPIDINLDDEAWEELSEQSFSIIESNAYTNLIYHLFLSLNDVYGFYAAYIKNYIFETEEPDFLDLLYQVEDSLLDLAACKLDLSQIALSSNFSIFRHQTLRQYETWLNDIKKKAFQARLPLHAELLDLVHESSDILGHQAEREMLGFNQHNIHPDIYMNELLIGMRTIHQVLPTILKKLEINDFMPNDDVFHS